MNIRLAAIQGAGTVTGDKQAGDASAAGGLLQIPGTAVTVGYAPAGVTPCTVPLTITLHTAVGPGENGEYTLRKSSNDCVPDCAGGTISAQDLHWDGSDNVP